MQNYSTINALNALVEGIDRCSSRSLRKGSPFTQQEDTDLRDPETVIVGAMKRVGKWAFGGASQMAVWFRG